MAWGLITAKVLFFNLTVICRLLLPSKKKLQSWKLGKHGILVNVEESEEGDRSATGDNA